MIGSPFDKVRSVTVGISGGRYGLISPSHTPCSDPKLRTVACSGTRTGCDGSSGRRPSPRGLGRMVKNKATGKTRYVGLGFHDLRRANATGLVAAGVDVKTAQGLLGHSDSRLTLDHYAQVVTELSEAAAAAMGARFGQAPARDERAMEAGSRDDGDEHGRHRGDENASHECMLNGDDLPRRERSAGWTRDARLDWCPA
jgi:hypothetical protein